MMMVASPAFRGFVIILVIVIVGGIWLLIQNQNKESEKREQARQVEEYYAATAIKEADIKLDNVNLTSAPYGLGDFVLSGTVANDSSAQLGTILFRVTITDCQDTNCRIVGQKDASASVAVPSKQMRAFSSYAIKFENLPSVGTARRSWSYRITGLRAKS